MTRLQTQRFVVVRNGLFMATKLILGNAPVAPGFGIIRFQTQRFVVVRNGLLVATEGAPGIAPVVPRFGMTRLQTDRPVVVRDGLFMATEGALGNPPVAPGFGIVRLQTQRFVVVCDGLFMATEVFLGIAPVAPGFGIVRFQTQRFVVVRNGLFVATEGALGVAPVVPGIGIARLQTQRLVIGVYGLLEFLALLAEIADGEPCPRRELVVAPLRYLGDGAPFGGGFLDVSLPLEQDSGGDRLEHRGGFRVRLDTLCCLLGSSRVFGGVLGGHLLNGFHMGGGLVALCFDFYSKASGCRGVLRCRFRTPLGILYALPGVGLDLAEAFETHKAGDGDDDGEQGQEDGGCLEPPVEASRPVVQHFAPQVVEVAVDVHGGGIVQGGRLRDGGGWRRFAGGRHGGRGLLRGQRRREGEGGGCGEPSERGGGPGHAAFPVWRSVLWRRILPEMSLGRRVSRRLARVRD